MQLMSSLLVFLSYFSKSTLLKEDPLEVVQAGITEEVGRQLGKIVLRQVDRLYFCKCIFLSVFQIIALGKLKSSE